MEIRFEISFLVRAGYSLFSVPAKNMRLVALLVIQATCALHFMLLKTIIWGMHGYVEYYLRYHSTANTKKK